MPVAPNPFLGIGFHAVGATCASTCYTPQKKVKGWSWQTYWITQASFCWLILPIVGAVAFIPHLHAVLAEAWDSPAGRSAMGWAFGFGMIYGIGGTAFGIAIRYIGFSLTYAIAVGLSAVVGTIVPPVAKGIYREAAGHPGESWGHYLAAGFGQISEIAQKPGGAWVLGGVAVGTLGIAFCGWAGHSKESDLGAGAKSTGFNLTRGLLISILAGFLSAVYGFAIEAGQPLADLADKHGADIYQGLIVYPFSNTGAFITTALYCLYLTVKHKSAGEFVALPAADDDTASGSLPMNFTMAALTGFLWYGQFFFYNFGHVHMGSYKFSSWAIHMIMLVLISNGVGVVLKEWVGCKRATRLRLRAALGILVAAVCMLTWGNQRAEKAAAAPAPAAKQQQ
ncbi:MAG: L-rhamnose/proton symporter RhaT [Phycisphaerae bacterium]